MQNTHHSPAVISPPERFKTGGGRGQLSLYRQTKPPNAAGFCRRSRGRLPGRRISRKAQPPATPYPHNRERISNGREARQKTRAAYTRGRGGIAPIADRIRQDGRPAGQGEFYISPARSRNYPDISDPIKKSRQQTGKQGKRIYICGTGSRTRRAGTANGS